jgi:3-oxoacyl-(acyl-carrier-protein) synthase/SAM-dependent methyltransferase/NAD(P)-dependent dehydrogenase (short-subunit alcohol dehydrogenase family)/aryl carrier-like protein
VNHSLIHQTLQVVEDLERRLTESEAQRFAPIAVLGMACRVPGASSIEELWDLVVSGRRAFRDATERWPEDGWYSLNPKAPGRSYIKDVGLIDNPAHFDAAFFGISPREAERMDPQHRLLLELAWEALERSGISPHALSETPTGVFAGVYNTNYARLGIDSPGVEAMDAHTLSGGAPCIATGRISYHLGLHGPSITLDTACSSSLVAVQLAMESLRRGECSLALAGGSHLLLSPLPLIALSKARMVSPSGVARAFDAAADGFVPGEGGGMVVLKRLRDAERDGDPILAVIRGGAVNQDGRSIGLTAPSGRAQTDLFQAAFRNAGVRPDEIGYIETHGTSTRLGDPIEVNAISAAFGEHHPDLLHLGALKNNIGHLEAAAGVLGLIKAAMVLQHGVIPPCAGFDSLNPEIDLTRAPLSIPKTARPWPSTQPRLAAVSAFGFSGTNASLILSSAPSPVPTMNDGEGPAVLMISGRSAEALREIAVRYARVLEKTPDSFSEICRAAITSRAHFEHRLALTAKTAREASALLNSWLAGGRPPQVLTGQLAPDTYATLAAVNIDAHAYVHGALPSSSPGRPIDLPTYPFQRRHFWFDPANALLDTVEPAIPANGISHYFDAVSEAAERDGQLRSNSLQHHVTFGVFPEPVPGFSFVHAFFDPESYPEQYAALLEGQRRLKSILFSQVDLERVDRVLDYGCGLGSDLLDLAQRYPRMKLDGFTISGEQATLANRRASELRLSNRLRIYHRDSAAESFPGQYDLVLGFEVTSLIARKDALFDNICSHLRPGGHLLIADCIAPVAIANSETSTYTLTADEWSDLLSPRRLRVVELVDVSRQVANCIDDPSYQERLEAVGTKHGFDAVTMRHLSSHGRIGQALHRGHLQYVLLHAVHERASSKCLWVQNGRWFRQPLSFSDLARDTATEDALADDTAPLCEPRWTATNAPLSKSAKPVLASELVDGTELQTYQSAQRLLESLATAYCTNAIRILGFPFALGDRIELSRFAQDRSVLPKFHRFLRRIFQILVEEQVLREDRDGTFVVARELPEFDIAGLCLRLEGTGIAAPELRLLRRCGSHLADALTGGADPIELLFEGGSLADAEALYRESLPSRILNRAMAALLRSEFERQAPSRPLRVLEVGAGTGSTTQSVLPILPPASEYCFTDVSRHFLRTAQKRLGAAIEYKIFNLEMDPATQDFGGRQFDLIVATNVMHATADVRVSLHRLLALLAPGGRLALAESVGVLRWVDTIFGLTDGWWSFSDKDLRPNHPLLSPEQWKSVLALSGLHLQAVAPEQAVTGMMAFLAQAPPRWLILPDSHGVAGQVADYIANKGIAKPEILPGIPSTSLLQSAQAILDFRALDLADDAGPGPMLSRVVNLVTALGTLKQPPALRLYTRGACAIGNRAVSHPGQAALWGLGRVLASEQPALKVQLLDLDPRATLSEVANQAVVGAPLEMPFAGWDAGMQFRFELVRKVLPDSSISFPGNTAYLITGGYGGLGMATADWLCSRGARHIWLAGRGQPSPSAQAGISRLRQQGAEIHCEFIDVAEANQVHALTKRIESAGVPLRGVFSSAGVLEDQSVALLSPDVIARVLEPKVNGVWNLHRATQDLNLDWFVVYSSAASVMGTPGQGAHAAANAWLDALIHYRRGRGLPGTSINWGAWSETGSAAKPEILAALARRGVTGLTNREALQALETVMAGGAPQMAVVRVDWERFGGPQPVSPEPSATPRKLTDTEVPPIPLTTIRGRLRDALPRERKQEVLSVLEPMAKEVLGMRRDEVLHPRQPLRDAGLDSLLSLDLRDRISREIGRPLPATLLFERPTLDNLADYVLEELGLAAAAPTNGALSDLSTDELGMLLDQELFSSSKGAQT